MTEAAAPRAPITQSVRLTHVPHVRTRPSIVHLIVGNSALVAGLVAYYERLLPGWSIIGAAFLLYLLGVSILNRRTDALRQRFTDQRLPEVQAVISNENEARRQVQREFNVAVPLNPTVRLLVIPALLLTLPFLYFVFRDVDQVIHSWFWLFRWPVAAVAAFFSWVFVVGVASFANVTPALVKFDLAEMRKKEQQAVEANVIGEEVRNDLSIIRQMASLQSLHRRIETYTLESALLSALSFSSFLSILMEGGPEVAQSFTHLFPLPVTWQSLPSPIVIPSVGQIASYPTLSLSYVSANVTSFIGLSLLFCAATFLGVLVARLRFNDGYRDAESLLKAAERLNEKEDQALERGETARSQSYTNAIDERVRDAETVQRGLALTVMHMLLSRNTGILFFMIALTLCGFYFNPLLAAVIAALFIGATFIGYLDRIFRGLLNARVFRGGVNELLKQTRR
ncbi:MAG: hypothetical protein AB7O98_16225 [Hyphomonadaceae bacterium]